MRAVGGEGLHQLAHKSYERTRAVRDGIPLIEGLFHEHATGREHIFAKWMIDLRIAVRLRAER